MGTSAVSSLVVEVGASEGVPPEAAVCSSSPTKTRSSSQHLMICCWWSQRHWALSRFTLRASSSCFMHLHSAGSCSWLQQLSKAATTCKRDMSSRWYCCAFKRACRLTSCRVSTFSAMTRVITASTVKGQVPGPRSSDRRGPALCSSSLTDWEAPIPWVTVWSILWMKVPNLRVCPHST